MKYILILLALSFNVSASEFDLESFLNKTYITVGIAHKIQETELSYTKGDGKRYSMNDPTSAIFEIGYQYSKNITFGLSHHSQYFTGKPFNNRNEYAKTEIFLSYKFTLSEAFN